MSFEISLEPIVGWRAWKLAQDDGGILLSSIIYEAVWPPRQPLVSTCVKGGCLAARWPALEHSCGIHAFKLAHGAAEFPEVWESVRFSAPPGPEDHVIGKVSLWGRVTEHERGFRGEYAYPYELLLSPRQSHLAHTLASAYAVDVAIGRD